MSQENDAEYLRFVASSAPTTIDTERLRAIAKRLERTRAIRRHLSAVLLVIGALLVFWFIFATTEPCKPLQNSNTLQEWINCRPGGR